MKNVTLLLAFLLAGAACSSAAAPGAENVVAQKDKATSLQVEAALRNAALAQETFFVENQTYTADMSALQQMGYNASPGVDLRIARGDATTYCIDSSSAGEPVHIGTPEKAPLPGACA